ncbi:MAG: hypothetical protein F4246_02150 [Rhodothermaceae bacterium]|nr:hypothetical protein [Rhodothermaceae bacterium]MXX58987.1 hypothetical protein [Rhodothermaceae bacterium]MYD20381.1 hypothetical protein [Rhodothermaceae bacterium]MYD55797.1 hypothetical protein [Rhodothermaceae bacterium]MYI43982.1 hypothetical protein [Rhodothermaceae bacterium]
MSNPDAIPTGTFAWLRKEETWGCRVAKEIEPGTTTKVDVHRKDGSSETKTVKVFWVGEGVSLGSFVDN